VKTDQPGTETGLIANVRGFCWAVHMTTGLVLTWSISLIARFGSPGNPLGV